MALPSNAAQDEDEEGAAVLCSGCRAAAHPRCDVRFAARACDACRSHHASDHICEFAEPSERNAGVYDLCIVDWLRYVILSCLHEPLTNELLGILSLVQMSRLKLFRGYYLGTGLLSVVGTSFATLSTATAVCL